MDSAGVPRFWSYGGFWRRGGALVVDTLFLLILGAQLHLATTALVWPALLTGFLPWIGTERQGPGIFVAWAYFVILTALWQATPGKRVMNLRVTDVHGRPPSLRHVLLREVVGRPLSVMLLGLGYVMAAITPDKRGLHDLIAGTQVLTAARPDEIDAGLRRIDRILATEGAVVPDQLVSIARPLRAALADEYLRRHAGEAVVLNGTLRLTGNVELI